MLRKCRQSQSRKLLLQIVCVHFPTEFFQKHINVHQIPDTTASLVKMLCHMSHHVNIEIFRLKIIHIQKTLSAHRPGQIREIGILPLVHCPVIHGSVRLHHDSRCFPIDIMMLDLLLQDIPHGFQFHCRLLHEISVDQNVNITHFPQKRRRIIEFHPGSFHGLTGNLCLFHPFLQLLQFLQLHTGKKHASQYFFPQKPFFFLRKPICF